MSFTTLVVLYLVITFIVTSLVYVRSFWPYHISDEERTARSICLGFIWPILIGLLLLKVWLKFLEGICKNASK
jgi:hypothetical protein